MIKFIGVDLDGTVNNFLGGFFDTVDRLLGVNTYRSRPSHEQKTSWGLEYYLQTMYGLGPARAKDIVNEALNSEGFFRRMEVLPNAGFELKRLSEEYKILFITKPLIGNSASIIDKLEWVDHYFPFIGSENTICTFDKSIFSEDSVLIDDDLHNYASWAGKVIRVDYPYNREADSPNLIGSLTGWENGYEKIKLMLK